jgi:hypothetical protein
MAPKAHRGPAPTIQSTPLPRPESPSCVLRSNMEAVRYKRLLERPKLFQPSESEYFEIWEDEVRSLSACHSEADFNKARGLGQGGHHKLKEEDIDNFIDREVSCGSWIANYPW